MLDYESIRLPRWIKLLQDTFSISSKRHGIIGECFIIILLCAQCWSEVQTWSEILTKKSLPWFRRFQSTVCLFPRFYLFHHSKYQKFYQSKLKSISYMVIILIFHHMWPISDPIVAKRRLSTTGSHLLALRTSFCYSFQMSKTPLIMRHNNFLYMCILYWSSRNVNFSCL